MTVLLVLVACYACLLLVVGAHLVFHAYRSREGAPFPTKAGEHLAEVSLQVPSGTTLHVSHVTHERAAPRPTVALLHGWHASSRRMWARMRMLLDAGYDVLVYDQRSHGSSSTALITFGPAEGRDLIAVLDWLHRQGQPGHAPVAVLAVSLGASAVIHALGEVDRPVLRCVVLESVFPRSTLVGRNGLRRILGRVLGDCVAALVFTPGAWLVSLGRFRHSHPATVVPDVSPVPALFLRGGRDALVSSADAQLVFDAWPGPKDEVVLPGGGHSDVGAEDCATYSHAVLTFLARWVLGSRSCG